MQTFRIITPDKTQPFTIGRKPENTLVLHNPMVSRFHAKIEFANGQWILASLTQNSVTQVNGEEVQSRALEDGDVILIGPLQLRATLKSEKLQLLLMESAEQDLVQTQPLSRKWEMLDHLHMDLPENTTARINSKGQAELYFKNKLVDTQGKSTHSLHLSQGESAKLPSCEIRFAQEELTFKNLPQGFEVQVENLDVFAGKKQLLRDINFTLPAGEILAIIGRSGQGKSSLLRLLQGIHRCGENATVSIGSMDYRNVEIRKHIAFLEQDPELRLDLSVKETLLDGGRIGMNWPDFKKNGLTRLEKFCELFGLGNRLESPLKTLSGGERRRVALARELMGTPGLIVLDEPLSGLDPYNSKILCTHLKQLAFLGHTIILTTHSYEALDIANKVLVLHQGEQGFYGSPQEAFRYFKSHNAETILANLSDETGSQWNTLWQMKKVDPQTIEISKVKKKDSTPCYFQKTDLSPLFFYKISLMARQWFRDKGKFWTLLLQPLIIGFLFSQIFSPQTSLWIVAFAVILSANWLALSLSIREIVQEKEILQTELRKGCSLFKTLAAKFTLPVVVAWLQTLVVFIFVSFRTEVWPANPLLLLTILAMILPAVAVGLTVSAFSKNSGQANALLPLLIIPQVALAGALVPQDQMHSVGRFLSYAIWSRYNQSSLLNILLERNDPALNTVAALIIALCFYIVVAIKLNCSKNAK